MSDCVSEPVCYQMMEGVLIMEFWIFLLCVIAVFLVFPYLRCLVKRLICLRKLSRICHQKQFALHGVHPLWFLGSKWGRVCDCYIETPNEIYAVKLFGMPRRLTVLLVRESGEYIVRSFIAILPHVRFTLHSRPRVMPIYDFHAKFSDAWEIKTPHHVLLLHPTSMEIRRQPQRGPEVIVGNGDVINGMEIASLPGLLGALECAI